MNVVVGFGRRSATLLYILYIVGGDAASAPGARQTARPNMTDQNTKSNLICVKFGIRESTKSLIMNSDPQPTWIKIQKSKTNFIIIRSLLFNEYMPISNN